MNIHVSNLDSTISNEDLKNLFSNHGEVQSAEVVTDAFTGQSRGYGFVEMTDEAAAQKAIDSLNNAALNSRPISVQAAKPKEIHKGSYPIGNGAVKGYRFKKR